MKIPLAIDASELSDEAVDEVARQHSLGDSEVRVISVVEPAYFPQTFSGEPLNLALYAEIEQTGRERAREAIEKAATKLRTDAAGRQFKVTAEVLSGSPKRMILEEAEAFGADLIIVGSHGHGMVERFLLGSVSQAVALHAKCSVEIVRRPKTLFNESKRPTAPASS